MHHQTTSLLSKPWWHSRASSSMTRASRSRISSADGNPKQKESQDSEEIPMCTVPGCCRRHHCECIQNRYIDSEQKEANKALSKLKSLQLIKQQGCKSEGKKSSSSAVPSAKANSAEIAQLEKAKAAVARFEEINTDGGDFSSSPRFSFRNLDWDSSCPNSEYHVYSTHTCLDVRPILDAPLGSALDCATTGD
eukprot:727852-Rhodomonas_salina.1